MSIEPENNAELFQIFEDQISSLFRSWFMDRPLHILFYSYTGYGHLNPCLGVAENLRRHGHKCTFLIRQSWARFPEELGYSTYAIPDEELTVEKKKQLVMQYADLEAESLIGLGFMDDPGFWADAKLGNEYIPAAIEALKPDILLECCLSMVPIVDHLDIPWIHLHSPSPQGLYNLYTDKVPPAMSGFPLADPSKWDAFKKDFEERRRRNIDANFAKFCLDNLSSEPDGWLYARVSPYLNIFHCPEEIDYENIFQLPENYMRLDHMIRVQVGEEDIPADFLSKPGHLIYFTFGSWMCCLYKVMNRLLKLLSELPHKFIVSCGSEIDPASLPSNCWGKKFLNQISILKKIDLIIYHGGHNSTVECFYYGVPMIILPIFFDELDNAQRIDEVGLGKRFHPMRVTKEELEREINHLTTGPAREKMRKIGERMRSSNTGDNFVKRVEHIVKCHGAALKCRKQ